MGDLQQFLQPDACVPEGLDHRPGPERVVLGAGDVDPGTGVGVLGDDGVRAAVSLSSGAGLRYDSAVTVAGAGEQTPGGTRCCGVQHRSLGVSVPLCDVDEDR